jgi:hypothetical protein
VRNDDFLQQDEVISRDGPEQNDNFGWSLALHLSGDGFYGFE